MKTPKGSNLKFQLSLINHVACTVVDVDALCESDSGWVALQLGLLGGGQQRRLPAGGLKKEQEWGKVSLRHSDYQLEKTYNYYSTGK